MQKITQKITGYKVAKAEEVAQAAASAKRCLTNTPVNTGAVKKRPPRLQGETFQVKSPHSNNAFYLTVNSAVDDAGDARLLEVFVNTKAEDESSPFIKAFTRAMSAMFRQSKNTAFLVSEMIEVFDPRGGYFIPGAQGKKANSEVSHIGMCIMEHMETFGIKGKADEAQIMERPETLRGYTRKIKSPYPGSKSLYLTINNIVNEDGSERPFEFLLTGGEVSCYQWMSILGRTLSAISRHTANMQFIAEELQNVYDIRGSYGVDGRNVGSVIAHIGLIIEQHLEALGLSNASSEKAEMVSAAKKMVEEKMAKKGETAKAEASNAVVPGATVCGKCGAHAVIKLDGCLTCLECGDSKCS